VYIIGYAVFVHGNIISMHRCGPLVKNWCMRFEGKHKYFKKIAQTLGNFKNIAKTVATRHQRYMCYKLTCCQFLEESNIHGSGILAK